MERKVFDAFLLLVRFVVGLCEERAGGTAMRQSIIVANLRDTECTELTSKGIQ